MGCIYIHLSNRELSNIRNLNRHFDSGSFRVVGIAASSGGLKAIIEIISDLPEDFPIPILLVLHIYPTDKSYLPEILSRHTKLLVKEAEDGDKLTKGVIYTPKPNKHIVVNSDGTITLSSTGKANFVRPAADVLFVTMAISYQGRSIAVILTGAGQDGAVGSLAVKKTGGKTIAQEDPEYPGMPDAAIQIDDVDFVVPLAEIAPLLIKLVMG